MSNQSITQHFLWQAELACMPVDVCNFRFFFHTSTSKISSAYWNLYSLRSNDFAQKNERVAIHKIIHFLNILLIFHSLAVKLCHDRAGLTHCFG